jgi:MFS family permease
LGINQGFCWSMTVTAKFDIARPDQRGLATGVNEFAGYGGVAIAGLATGYLASQFDPRTALFAFGLIVNLLALAAALLAFAETRPQASAASKASGVSAKSIFALVTWRNRDFQALSQAGSIEKFVDALMWALVPVYLAAQGVGLVTIGWITATYGLVWGASQLLTGPLSDRIGRKPPIVAGFAICAAGVAAFPLLSAPIAWAAAAAVTGIGMGLLYPNLIAAVGDLAAPEWRGSALGVYRFWRDLGYAFGALAIGLVADASGYLEAGFWVTAGAMALSGLWLWLALSETHQPAKR